MLINDRARAMSRHQPQRQMKLVVAVASKRMENIPRRALRMDANNRQRSLKVAQHKRQQSLRPFRLLPGIVSFKGNQAELRPVRWKADFCNLVDHEQRSESLTLKQVDCHVSIQS